MLFVLFSILILLVCVTFLRNIYNRVVNLGEQIEKLVKHYEKVDKENKGFIPEEKGRKNGQQPSGESSN
jgi:cell division protein FtsB